MSETPEETDALLITEAILGYAVVLGERGDLAEAAWTRVQERLASLRQRQEETDRELGKYQVTLGTDRTLGSLLDELASLRTQLQQAEQERDRFERAVLHASDLADDFAHLDRESAEAHLDRFVTDIGAALAAPPPNTKDME